MFCFTHSNIHNIASSKTSKYIVLHSVKSFELFLLDNKTTVSLSNPVLWWWEQLCTAFVPRQHADLYTSSSWSSALDWTLAVNECSWSVFCLLIYKNKFLAAICISQSWWQPDETLPCELKPCGQMRRYLYWQITHELHANDPECYGDCTENGAKYSRTVDFLTFLIFFLLLPWSKSRA